MILIRLPDHELVYFRFKKVIINNTIYLFPGALGMLHSSEIPRTFYSSSLPYFTIRDLQLHCNGKYRFRINDSFTISRES